MPIVRRRIQAGRCRRLGVHARRSRPAQHSRGRAGARRTPPQPLSGAGRRSRALCRTGDRRLPRADARAGRGSRGPRHARSRGIAGGRRLRRGDASGQPARVRHLARQRLHHQHRQRRRSRLARVGADPAAPAIPDEPAVHRAARMPGRARLLGPPHGRAGGLPLDPGRTRQAHRAVPCAWLAGEQGPHHRARCRRRLRRQEPADAGGHRGCGAGAEGRPSGALDRGPARASARRRSMPATTSTI